MLSGKFWANVVDLPLQIQDSGFLLPQNVGIPGNLVKVPKFNMNARFGERIG